MPKRLLNKVISLQATPYFFRQLCLCFKGTKASITLFLCFWLAFPASTNAGQSYIRICNRGDTEVWAVLGTDMGTLGGLQTKGWFGYEPGNSNILGGCTAIVTNEGNGFYLGFIVKDKNGRVTPVVLPPSRTRNGISATKLVACVPRRSEFKKRIRWKDTNRASCGSGEMRLAFSAEIDTWDSFNDKEFDITYTIKPRVPKQDNQSRRDKARKENAPKETKTNWQEIMRDKTITFCRNGTPAVYLLKRDGTFESQSDSVPEKEREGAWWVTSEGEFCRQTTDIIRRFGKHAMCWPLRMVPNAPRNSNSTPVVDYLLYRNILAAPELCKPR